MGRVMDNKNTPIPFNRPFIVGQELYYIAQAVIGGQLAGDGPFTKRCHQWLEERIGCRKALLDPFVHRGPEMSAMLCGIGPGDEVIMPSFTFVSTANAFVLRERSRCSWTYGPTPQPGRKLIEQAPSPPTRQSSRYTTQAFPAPWTILRSLRNDLYVIEDAAQGLLSTYKKKYLARSATWGA